MFFLSPHDGAILSSFKARRNMVNYLHVACRGRERGGGGHWSGGGLPDHGGLWMRVHRLTPQWFLHS